MGRRKKSRIRDYAVAAFEKYAAIGCPTREEYENIIREEIYRNFELSEPKVILMKVESELLKKKPLLEDLEAIARMIRTLENTKKDYILEAVKNIYFTSESRSMKYRVISYSAEHYTDERSVYRWLRYARELFAYYRGLTLS